MVYASKPVEVGGKDELDFVFASRNVRETSRTKPAQVRPRAEGFAGKVGFHQDRALLQAMERFVLVSISVFSGGSGSGRSRESVSRFLDGS